MARRLQVNECMLCGCAPCECNVTKKSLPAKKALVVKKASPPVKRLVVQAPKPAPPAPPAPKPRLTVEVPEEDAQLIAAIRVLWAAGLLSGDDRDKYRHAIVSGHPIEDRAAAWRSRREAR